MRKITPRFKCLKFSHNQRVWNVKFCRTHMCVCYTCFLFDLISILLFLHKNGLCMHARAYDTCDQITNTDANCFIYFCLFVRLEFFFVCASFKSKPKQKQQSPHVTTIFSDKIDLNRKIVRILFFFHHICVITLGSLAAGHGDQLNRLIQFHIK